MAHHEHHHENCCCEECSGIVITSHEGALIGTLTGRIAADSVLSAKERLCAAMAELAALINRDGGVVGHIKAIVCEEGRGYQISVTDGDAEVRSLPPSAYRADCAAIVFAIEENALRSHMQKTVGALMIPDAEHGCDERCEHEHHHSHD